MDINEYKKKYPDFGDVMKGRPIIIKSPIQEFAEKLEKNTKDMPTEIAELVDKHFWELV